MGAKAHGRILFWEGASLWLLSAPPGVRYPKMDPHPHHVIQVTLALTGRVDCDSETAAQSGGQPERRRRARWPVAWADTPPVRAANRAAIRTYWLWLRLVRAVEIFAGGATLTDAAHGADFADSAHLSRTFRRMFGIVAASLRVS